MIIALVVVIVAVVSWMMFEAGRIDRRMPKETNLNDGWWHDEIVRNPNTMQIENVQKN